MLSVSHHLFLGAVFKQQNLATPPQNNTVLQLSIAKQQLYQQNY